jgi:hypothetical protein
LLRLLGGVNGSDPLGEEGVERTIRVIPEQPTGEPLGVVDNFVDRPDTDLTTLEFHDDLAAPLEADCLAKFRRNAEAT